MHQAICKSWLNIVMNKMGTVPAPQCLQAIVSVYELSIEVSSLFFH